MNLQFWSATCVDVFDWSSYWTLYILLNANAFSNGSRWSHVTKTVELVGQVWLNNCPLFELLQDSLQLNKAPIRLRLRLRSEDDQLSRQIQWHLTIFSEIYCLRNKCREQGMETKYIFSLTAPKKVTRQRSAFSEVRGIPKCCKGVCYGLFYPAELNITQKYKVRQSFKDA